MSKKSRRARLARHLQQPTTRTRPVPSEGREQIGRIQQAQKMMIDGDFAGAISTCEALLTATTPMRSERRVEVLALLGLSHGMSSHFLQSYEVFDEAIKIDSTIAELWYNHGLASRHLGRRAEAVLNFERAIELLKDEPSEMASRFVEQLKQTRDELEEAMQEYEASITFEEYLEIEKRFAQGMSLIKQEKWPEAERIFRELTEVGNGVLAHWANLGICLLMQFRYDEAEKAFKRVLAIDSTSSIARDNLKKLPEVRRSKKLEGLQPLNLAEEEDGKQVLTLYEKDESGEVVSATTIEQAGQTTTGIKSQLGKQTPRYRLFLNPYTDRFTTCPRCQVKTRARKFTLLVNVHPTNAVILDKICRYCDVCSLLTVHQDQLEVMLARHFSAIKPEVISNDYHVLGTLDRAKWNQEKQAPLSIGQVLEHMHDFQEVVMFEYASQADPEGVL